MANLRKELPRCQYGALCYRTSAEHRNSFWHPQDEAKAAGSNGRPDKVSRSECEADGIETEGGEASPESYPSSFTPPENSSIPTRLGNVGREGRTEGKPAPDDTERGLQAGNRKESAAGIGDLGLGATMSAAEPDDKAEITKKVDEGAILLLLVGVPGSGKSTFCEKLVLNATAQPWIRICQDIIAKGKRGTRKECLKQSEQALTQRHSSVVIDRCNIDKDQRSEFLQLAKTLGVQAHAVVLNLPVSLCIDRASKRSSHEGGISDGNAKSVINRVFRTRQMPTLSEGFARITFCRTDADVEKTLQQYREALPSKPLELGVCGGNSVNEDKEKSAPRGVQPNAAVNVLDNSDWKSENGLQNGQKAESIDRETSEQESYSSSSRRSAAAGSTDNNISSNARVAADDQGSCTLAFPSVSTLDFQFDHKRAADVLVEVVSEFLTVAEHSKLRLVLVDLTDSHIISLVRQRASDRGLDLQRFFVFVGDITRLRSSRGPACNIIANAANWRLRAGGGGVNAAVHKAAGPDLEHATHKVAQTLSPGAAVAVQLPESSPLRQGEGVTHVIHVLGPNMNPRRPNCLSGDYLEGDRVLRNAYASLFKSFSAIALQSLSASTTGRTTANANSEDIDQKPPTKNAFTVLMQASKRNREALGSTPKRDKVRVTEEVAARAAGKGSDNHAKSQDADLVQSVGAVNISASQLQGGNENLNSRRGGVTTTSGNQEGSSREGDQRKWQSWALHIYNIAMHPERHEVSLVTSDAVVLRDAFPKAKHHMLVVARKEGLDSLEDLRPEHLPVLQHMHSLGEEWAASFLKQDSSLSFRLGYHSVPSMRQVHLHVISQDFDSASLKNKKHWNSFTTPFFRDSVDVLNQLKEDGRLQICVKDAEELLDLELRCHRCRSVHPNLPRLKQHISSCTRPFVNALHLITSKES